MSWRRTTRLSPRRRFPRPSKRSADTRGKHPIDTTQPELRRPLLRPPASSSSNSSSSSCRTSAPSGPRRRPPQQTLEELARRLRSNPALALCAIPPPPRRSDRPGLINPTALQVLNGTPTAASPPRGPTANPPRSKLPGCRHLSSPSMSAPSRPRSKTASRPPRPHSRRSLLRQNASRMFACRP